MSTSIEHESQKDPDVLEQEINAKRERISDIVDSLESRLSPGQLFDQALAYTKGNGGEFFGNLGTTLKNNPVPTALTAVGLAWLAMNQNRPFNPGPASHGPGLGDRLSGAVDSVKDAFSHAGDRLHSATDSAKDALSQAGDRLHSATDSAKAKAYDLKDKAAGLKDKASDFTHSTSDSLGQTSQSVRRSAHDARDQISHGADVVKSQFDYLLKEQPLVLAALGIALGAAIGAALPSTRKEDQLLGDASDKLTGTLKAKGEEVYSQAKETVKQTVNTESEPPRTGPGSLTGPGSTTTGPGSSPTGPGSSTTGAGGTDLSSGLGFSDKP
ncbi:MAG TPA: DUF3618 domain-containing protein [Pseudomonas sp.]|uniref:DUF3618 domain-containing protein n=1 Tax=Pseudomonas sp. TaxID=306 RepID=UPI002B463C09|nr:DUF3618 domain-containing protein [Pseudomonas sp.]HKS14127.1 DUF3618 domain-containing protein [Pseudomonas sp.]